MSWLSDLLGKTVKTEAETLPDRKVIRFIGPVTVEDNPSEGSTDVTLLGADSTEEIGGALADDDEVPITDATDGVVKHTLLSRFWTYIQAKGAALSEIGGALAGDDTIRIIDATDSTEKRSSLFRITTFILAAIPATYGTWAPTVSNTNNMDSTPTVSGGFYLRFATIEIAFAQISFDPTAASGASEFRLTPPVSSNFAVNSDVVGLVGGLTITNGRCLADGTNDLIRCVFTNSGSAVDTAYVVAGCKVI
jgi:hypothetical protein